MRSTLTRRIIILLGQKRHCNNLVHRTCRLPANCTPRGFSSTTSPPDDKDPSFSSSPSKYYNSQQQQQQQHKLHTDIPETNQAYKGSLEIRKTPVGWGLFATRDFAVGDWVMSTHVLDITRQADMHTIQLDQHTHAHIDLPARFMNHYCNQANVGVTMRSPSDSTVETAKTMSSNSSRPDQKNNERKDAAFDFYAIRPIQNEQELFFDYETTEFELSSPFDCSCGSPDCRGKLTGFRDHGDQVMAAYQEQFIAPYLVEWFRNNQNR